MILIIIDNKMAAEVVILKQLSAPVWLPFEPVGIKFRQHVHRMVNGLNDPQAISSSSDEGSDSEEEKGDTKKDTSQGELDLSSLDPTQWKDQDHYAVLGLGKLRYKATAKEIKKAYQGKALQHHPDKQETVEDDTLFKCIQVAYEILSNPKRRRGFDSVDPTFVDSIPKPSAVSSSEQFFSVFGPAFENNARWSNIQPVPSLGGPDSDLEYVEDFYRFWYEFSSWREFSYLDEENTEKAENRDERRWMEKQNKTARQKRKKEEVARIRSLVDNAYSCDPRIKKFKELERSKKEAQKRAKEEAIREEARRKEEEKKKKEEEERRAREEREAEEKRVQAQQKQEREAVKKALKKERKQLRSICREQDYFSASNEAQRLVRMQQVDRICETLTVESLVALNQELSSVESVEQGGEVIEREITMLLRKEEEGLRKAEEARLKASSQKGGFTGEGLTGCWSREEVQLLIKAVNLYPAGTSRRWQVIADYINQHVSTQGRSTKNSEQVVAKVKSLKKMDSSEREVENKKAFENFKQTHGSKTGQSVSATPTERDVNDVSNMWTADEQKLLEGALRTYPVSTPKRWDKIADMVPSRSKEECIARFKELVAKVKSKKQ